MRERCGDEREGLRRETEGGTEVEERSVMNRRGDESVEERTGARRFEPRAVQRGRAEDQSCLPSLPESPPWR